MGGIKSYRDLDVYQLLFELNDRVYKATLTFPSFEKFELGSQLRRAANSAPANLAEGWNNKHLNIYLEGINRALGEMREVEHHLAVAVQRDYIEKSCYSELIEKYGQCGRMLKALERSLKNP